MQHPRKPAVLPPPTATRNMICVVRTLIIMMVAVYALIRVSVG